MPYADPEKKKAYFKRRHLEIKERNREYWKEYRQRPEVKVRKKVYFREYRISHRDELRAKKRLKATGWTQEEFDAAWHRQKGVCPICLKPMEKFGTGENSVAADHDKETGQKRDLLHMSCNMGLGIFKEDPKRLARAAKYLMKHAKRTK